MNKKRKLLAILAMTIAVLCAAMAMILRPMRSPAKDGDTQTTLEFYQQREEAIGAFSAVIDTFSAEHPEINIVQNRAGNSLEYLSARIQRGDMPDLFTHWPTQLSYQAVAEAGKLVSLQDEAFLERVDASALELCQQDGKAIYALPINRNCMEVYYNADLFAELGLPEPRTLDELITVCDALQAAGHTPMVFYPRDNRTAHMAQGMMAALNSDYLTLLGELANGTISDADRENLLDALRLMRRLFVHYSDSNANRTYYDACESFARGECAMILTGSYALSLLREMEPAFEMSVFVFPCYDADRQTILTSIDTALCISSDCAHIDLALEFLEYITRDEVIAEYFARDGAPSCIASVSHDDPITQKMQRHISECENAEWIKSRYSLESRLTFESVIRSYLISGNEDALIDGIVTAFAAEANES